MPDTPFFRGQDRMDWLYAVMLSTAADWGGDDQLAEVASVFGDSTVTHFTTLAGQYPDVWVVVTPELVFIVCGSTKNSIQWIGNILGSSAVNVPPSRGTVAAYFGAVALSYYLATRQMVLAATGSRQLVIVGFSLGGATATILKDMFARNDALSSACVAFGNPRAGTTSFVAGYDPSNYAGFGVVNDPVPSVPPVIWSGLGLHNSWIPFPPFVVYAHVVSGNTLFLDGTIGDGYSLQSTSEIVLGFDTGVFLSFHNQALYAYLLRRRDLPEVLTDGFDGYPFASKLDNIAARVFSFGSNPWRWASVQPDKRVEERPMPSRLSLYIRDKASPPLGFREVYFFANDDPSAAFQAALGAVSPAQPYMTTRSNFLSNSCEIYAIGCNAVGGTKKSFLRKLDNPVSGALSPSTDIETSIGYFGFSSAHDAKRQFHFRGIPSSWETADKLTSIGRAGLPLITTFLEALKAGGMVIYGNNITIPNGKKITAGAKATQDSLITLTVDGSPGFPNGSLVVITGCKPAPLLNGQWLTSGPQISGQVVLGGSARYSCPASLTGTLRAFQGTGLTLSTFEFNGVSSKKTGRPSFLQRGRQSAKLRHR